MSELWRRFAPHQLRHAHAVEMAREGVPLIVIQRQLGHSNLGITSVYLQGIDSGEIIETVHAPTRADDSRQRIAAALIDSEAWALPRRAKRHSAGASCRFRCRGTREISGLGPVGASPAGGYAPASVREPRRRSRASLAMWVTNATPRLALCRRAHRLAP